MKAITKLIIVLLFISNSCTAQSTAIQKIAAQVSTENLQKNLYYLASDKLEGRLMGSHGDTLASLFIADWFKQHQLTAPYDGGTHYIQSVTAQKKVLSQAVITIAGKGYSPYDGWASYLPLIPSFHVKDIPVVIAGYDYNDSAYNTFEHADLKGKAVLIIPRVNKEIDRPSRTRITNILRKKGALALLVYASPFKDIIQYLTRIDFLPAYKNMYEKDIVATTVPYMLFSDENIDHLLVAEKISTKILQESILPAANNHCFNSTATISIDVEHTLQEVHAPNVIGMIKGSDPDAPCIVASAHHDHDGRNGNTIYYGAVDNASGTVALMEMAALMHKAVEQGFRPKRTIVFASFTGEERGLIGSAWYVDHPIYPVEKTFAVLNIDMMGRVDSFYSGKRADSNYAYILVKDSLNRGLRNAAYKANAASVNLKLDTYYELPDNINRRLTGSDQYPFYLKGVPFIRIDCGFCKDYHQPTDTPDKINYPLLTKQTQLAFLTLWNIAND